MAEVTVREILAQLDHPFRTFAIIRHHIGGFEDDELRRILVRAGAVRFVSKNDIEVWALRESVRNWEGKDVLKVWELGEMKTPPLDKLLPQRLLTKVGSLVQNC